MLSGERPFQGQYDAALSYAIVNEDPIPIRDYFQNAPQKLIEFFDRILAKQPEDRIESAATAETLLENMKDSTGSGLERTQKTVAAATSTNQETDSGSTTISITLPNFGFGNKHIGRTGLFAGILGVLAIILLAGWWFMGNNSIEDKTEALTTGSETEITDRSIAVLPFNNLSGTDEITSITRGIHDDLLTRLSNIGDLRVTSRTSVAHYRDTDLALPIIADSLGVRWIMVGGVQQGGDQIQVNAQLIDPQTDANVWADSYRRELTAENLFAIQEDITGEIAEALRAELSESEEERIANSPTRNLEAYQLYIQGRRELARRVYPLDEHALRAIELFRNAIEQDSSFALAWTGLADANIDELPDSLKLPNVNQKKAAQRALELDPNLAEAHAAMGHVHLREMNGPAAVQQLKRALELKPSYWEAHHLLGVFYLKTGRVKEALDHLELAVELNPQHARARHGLYDAYLASGQAKKSLNEARKQQRLGLEETSAIGGAVRALFGLGQLDEARRLAEEQISDPDVPEGWKDWFRAYLVSINSKAGHTDQSQKYLSQLQEEGEDPAQLGQAYAALGKTDLALKAYQQLSDEGWGRLGPSIEFRYGILYDLGPLSQDPRYEELIQKANRAWGLNPDGSIPEDIDPSDDM
jgi:TolB-like protein/Tfp pilus assembly protein PilF